jgi:hypothetical protein
MTTHCNTTQDARALSSGTIGSLIHETSYAIIDVVQNQFVQFCIEHEGEFETWVKAWSAFSGGCEAPKEYDKVEGEGAPQYTFLAAPDQQLALL